jgi:hypothetical protein
MSILNRNYAVEDGENGLRVIRLTGRCTPDEQSAIEANVCGRFRLITLPAAAGHVLKALDGSAPPIVVVRPPTGSRNYNCVKVRARCWPFAPVQESTSAASAYVGNAILMFEIEYVEVGGVV